MNFDFYPEYVYCEDIKQANEYICNAFNKNYNYISRISYYDYDERKFKLNNYYKNFFHYLKLDKPEILDEMLKNIMIILNSSILKRCPRCKKSFNYIISPGVCQSCIEEMDVELLERIL